MSTIPAYESEPYRTELEVTVVETGTDERGTYVVLDDTILYPAGGGQPADRGWLRKTGVVDVQAVGGEVRHYVEDPVEPGPAKLTLDWPRRFDHMQQHTAQHLITAIAADRFGWRTTAFHLGKRNSDVELDTPAPTDDELAAIENAVMAEVRAARPVSTRRVSPAECAALEVRSRGLPAGHEGDVRLVEIEGIDLNTCGGTHLGSTSEIESVKLLGTEGMRGGTRLHWIAGTRVRDRLREHEVRAAELRSVLETADDELVATAAAKIERLEESSRRARRLEQRLADEVATRLLADATPVADVHADPAGAGYIQLVARAFANADPSGVALISAAGEEGRFFALATGANSGLDIQQLGTVVAEILDGRGGGAGTVFQGKAGSLARRDDAVEALREALTRR